MSDTWDEQAPLSGETGERHPEPEPEPEPVELSTPAYSDVETWVTEWLSPLLRRKTNVKSAGVELAWCAQWWAHAEAIDRLESMWRAWETARVAEDPTAVAHWWLTIADPMLAVLLDADTGPFSGCRRDGHQQLPALPLDPSPRGWWGARPEPQV